MRLRFLKAYQHVNKRYVMGNIVNFSKGPALRLIREGTAEQYTGEYPPKKKMKRNLNQNRYGNN